MGTLRYSFGDAQTPTQTYTGEPTVDIDGDGEPDGIPLDFTGSGHLDSVAWDSDGDGVVDTILVSSGNDGQYDTAYYDPSGRGHWDVAEAVGGSPVGPDAPVEVDQPDHSPHHQAAPPAAEDPPDAHQSDSETHEPADPAGVEHHTAGDEHDPYAHLADVDDLPGHSDRPELSDDHPDDHPAGAEDPYGQLAGAGDEPDGFSHWSAV